MASEANGHFWACPKPDCDTPHSEPGDCTVHEIPLIEVDANGYEVTQLHAPTREDTGLVGEVARLTRERDEAQGALMAINDTLGLPAEALDDPERIGRALREALASRPAIPADAEDLAWSACMDDDKFNRLTSDQILEVIRRTLKAVTAATVSGSDTTEDGGNRG